MKQYTPRKVMLYPVTQVSLPVIQWYDRENTNYVIITHVSHKSIKENGSITICALLCSFRKPASRSLVWRKLIYF